MHSGFGGCSSVNTLIKAIHPFKGMCTPPPPLLVFLIDRTPAERIRIYSHGYIDLRRRRG
jgi:hypothetical protein